MSDGRDLTGVTVAGKYLIKRRIGAGGMGAVYEGEHVEIGKRVAIKVIEHQHAKSDELAARFKREAQAASRVESEHIVHVFDVGRDPEVGLYMVMEILSGTDLAARVENAGGQIPIEEATTLILQTARGLAKAHAAGVVHRDLKPANLFLTKREDGSPCVKILDFGISKIVRAENDPAKSKGQSLTREGMVIGTPQYMSPEQAQGLPVDARTDVWSLAAVAYEIYSGKPLFEARDTYEQMIVQIVMTKPKPLAEVAPRVPREVAAVIDAALVADVNARIPNAGVFAQRLADAAHMPRTSSPDLALGHAPTALATPAVTPAPVPQTAAGVEVHTRPGAARKNTIAAIGAIAGFVLVAAIGVGVALSRKQATPEPSANATPGLVAPPPPKETAPEPTLSAPTTKLSPLTAPPEPASAAPTTPASVAAKPVVAKPAPAKPAPSPATKPAGGSGQYGAAGVSTTY